MATLVELRDSEVIEIIDPLDDDELPWRTLYATKYFIHWLDNDLGELGHNALYDTLSPLEQVAAVFAEYASGDEFSTDKRFKKLSCNPDHHIWEFKTEEVRIFGWVPKKDTFICCYGDSKDRIELLQSYAKYIAQTAFVRKQMDLDEPKSLTSRNYSDVISTKD